MMKKFIKLLAAIIKRLTKRGNMGNIPTKEFDGDVAVKRNATIGGDTTVRGGMTVGHSLNVEGWLNAPNIKGQFAGFYMSQDSLEQHYPSPIEGWYALVANELWIAENGKWKATGQEGGKILGDIEELLKAEEKNKKDLDNIAHWLRTPLDEDPRNWAGGKDLEGLLKSIRDFIGMSSADAQTKENLQTLIEALRQWTEMESSDPGDWNGETLPGLLKEGIKSASGKADAIGILPFDGFLTGAESSLPQSGVWYRSDSNSWESFGETAYYGFGSQLYSGPGSTNRLYRCGRTLYCYNTQNKLTAFATMDDLENAETGGGSDIKDMEKVFVLQLKENALQLQDNKDVIAEAFNGIFIRGTLSYGASLKLTCGLRILTSCFIKYESNNNLSDEIGSLVAAFRIDQDFFSDTIEYPGTLFLTFNQNGDYSLSFKSDKELLRVYLLSSASEELKIDHNISKVEQIVELIRHNNYYIPSRSSISLCIGNRIYPSFHIKAELDSSGGGITAYFFDPGNDGGQMGFFILHLVSPAAQSTARFQPLEIAAGNGGDGDEDSGVTTFVVEAEDDEIMGDYRLEVKTSAEELKKILDAYNDSLKTGKQPRLMLAIGNRRRYEAVDVIIESRGGNGIHATFLKTLEPDSRTQNAEKATGIQGYFDLIIFPLSGPSAKLEYHEVKTNSTLYMGRWYDLKNAARNVPTINRHQGTIINCIIGGEWRAYLYTASETDDEAWENTENWVEYPSVTTMIEQRGDIERIEKRASGTGIFNANAATFNDDPYSSFDEIPLELLFEEGYWCWGAIMTALIEENGVATWKRWQWQANSWDGDRRETIEVWKDASKWKEI